MDGEERAGQGDLTRGAVLPDDPAGYHIFQALRLIEAAHADKPRLGESRRPSDDRVRLSQEVELAFPTSTIRSYVPPRGKLPGRLVSRFFGLFGPNGPLPLHLTEYVRDRVRNHRDTTLAEFANMFVHRMTSLLYRAWASAEPAPSFDRGTDPFERHVAAFAGLRGRRMDDRDAMPDLSKRFFAAHLGAGPRHPDGLLSIISAFFDVDAELEDFVGSWLELEPDDRWQLGAAAGLGQRTSLGSRVWSRAAKFRIRLGPMSYEEFQRLLPGGSSLWRLQAIVRNYLGDTLDWELQLVLRKDEVPKPVLGETVALGHSGWMGQREADADADDLHIVPVRAGHAHIPVDMAA